MENLNFFERAVKVVDKYGAFKVLTSIFMVGLFLFIIFYIPAITKITVANTTVKAIETVDEGKKVTHIQEVKRRSDIQPQVYSILSSIIKDTNADRAFVFELHNGVQNINSIPFLHASMTYEKTGDKINAIDDEYQNLSLSRYEFASYLHTDKIFLGTTDELRKIDRKFAMKMDFDEVVYLAIISLYGDNSEWGWLGVTYSAGEEIPSREKLLNDLYISSQSVTKVFMHL